jgi:hypothetical protein
MASIKDGTSNPIIVAETNTMGFKFGGFMTCGTGVVRVGPGEAVFRSAFVGTAVHGQCCEIGKYKEVDDSGAKTARWFRAGPHSFSPTYLTAWGPNVEWPGAGSLHPGIIQCLNGDASVRKVSPKLQWQVWAMVNGIADGAVPNSNDL